MLDVTAHELVLSAVTALIGAVVGALLAYVVVTGGPDRRCFARRGHARRGVLAQFGGVTLAFAFIATLGFSGVVTVLLRDHARHRHLRRQRAGCSGCPG